MTARSEEAKAELRQAEKKLADAKAELADAKAELADAKAELADAKAELADAKAELADAKKELKEAETQQGQVEQKLMETKHTDPPNTAEVQRLEQKLLTLNGDVAALRKAYYSKLASVESKEEVVRRLESQLPVIAGPAFASSGGERKMQSRQIALRHQHCVLMICEHMSACLSLSLSVPLSLCVSLSFSLVVG